MERKGGKHVEIKVDHSTQFFTATDERFMQLVDSLHKDGAVKEWTGKVGLLNKGDFTEMERAEKLWVGRRGIDSLPNALARDIRTVTDTWVATVERQEDTGKWRLFRDNNRRRRLSAKEGVEEDFDYIVVAHNGKCAERLMRDAQVPKLHRLLKTKFASSPPPAGVMQLSSLWVMTFVVENSIGLPFEGAFVQAHPDLCWGQFLLASPLALPQVSSVLSHSHSVIAEDYLPLPESCDLCGIDAKLLPLGCKR